MVLLRVVKCVPETMSILEGKVKWRQVLFIEKTGILTLSARRSLDIHGLGEYAGNRRTAMDTSSGNALCGLKARTSGFRPMQKKTHSPLTAVNLSLVSYTHNDNGLLAGSLAEVPGWSIRPKEIILVDDASATPFEVPDVPGLPPVTLLRTPRNLGYTGAKGLGMNKASCRFILSLDADTRIAPDWLALCIPRVVEPRIGMVSGPIFPRCGTHLLARYIGYSFRFNTDSKGWAEFLPGQVWLMRREVWHDVGGFAGYEDRAGEDVYLCAELRRRGYILWVEERAMACEVRPMKRLGMIRRGWSWQRPSIIRAMERGSSLLEGVNVLVYSMRERMLTAVRTDPRMLYYDLLYLLNGLFDLLPGLGSGAPLWASFRVWLAPYPGMAGALIRDVTDLGHPDAGEKLLWRGRESVRIEPGGDIAQVLDFAFDKASMSAIETGLDEILFDL